MRRTGQQVVVREGWKWPVRRTRARQSRAMLRWLTRPVVERNRVRRTGQQVVGGEGWKWPVRRTRAKPSRAMLRC